MNCQKVFREIYKREADGVSFCSYRVCPLGAHIDHQYGKILGFAIDKGIHIAYSEKKNGVVEMCSLQFEKRAQFHIASVPEKEGDWADHLRGATLILSKKYPLKVGVSGVIEGSLPIGGLSSSAAVIIAFLSALCKVNQIQLTDLELVMMAKQAENEYVGVSCGKLDQSCEVYSKKDHLLYLDTLDDTYELIPTNAKMKPYKIAIFFSGVERSLKTSGYNNRVEECKAAAFTLCAEEGIESRSVNESALRLVPENVFQKHKDKLPKAWQKRLEHYYSEFNRVEQGAKAWREGDIDTFGELIFQSGYSSIYNWETGSPELIKLYEIMKETDGVYGGRFSGAGFKGCCMAFIDPEKEDAIKERVTAEYLKAFPELKDKFSVHFCQSADGVNV